MEKEQIITEYDPVILKKLGNFTKPHLKWIIIGVLALMIATGADLIKPIVIQKTIDNNVLPHYSRVSANTTSAPEEGRIELSGYYYYHRNDYNEAPVDWHLVSSGDDAVLTLVNSKSDLFISDGIHIAISDENFNQLSSEERKTFRKNDINSIVRNSLFLIFLLFLGIIFTFVQIFLMALTSQNIMKSIRVKLFGHITNQSLSYLSETPVGRLVSGITNDVATIDELFTSVFSALLRDVLLMAGVVIALFYLDVKLALVTMVTLPPAFVIIEILRKKSREVFRRVRMHVSGVNSFLSEHISGMDIVQMFGREIISQKKFKEANDKLLKANINQMYVYAFFRPLIDLLASVSVAVIIYIGAGFHESGLISLGILIAYINLISKFFDPVKDIAEKFSIMQSAMAGGERVFSLFDMNNEIVEKEAVVSKKLTGAIEFKDVYFSYKADVPVLKGLDFAVEPGETVAIVGYTGAGKTTIASLLTRLWDINKGSILIDGVDIRDLSLKKLRDTVQPVQQDVFIFAGDIRKNITLGSDISDEKFLQAVKAAEVETFIGKFENGYETELSERGANLSVGQRQLLSFARALAHDPRILILDEATAHIDTETEELIQRAMKNLLKDRTSLVIAHRLSTIRNADRILVLNEGIVAEIGTHDELIDKKGIYHTLYNLQYQREIRV
jgi:ATP-binding cassette, subfamily B, multidrug efflux pump